MNHITEGEAEEDEASIDRPMKRKTESPVDMMARLTLTEGGTFEPSVEAQASEIAASHTADSLEALPPNPRNETQEGEGLSPYTSTFVDDKRTPIDSSEASQALKVLQSVGLNGSPPFQNN